MENRILLGMDFGTNGVKALAYEAASQKAIASAYKGYPVITPTPNHSEQIPEEWWKAFVWCVNRIKSQGGFSGEQIAAVCVSSHTPTLTPVDEKGNVLRSGMIWSDGRAVAESRELIEKHGMEIAEANPARIRPYHIISKLNWFKKNEPELYRNTKYFLECNNYIVYRLTGIPALDRSMATNYHFYNVHKKQWDIGLARLLDVDLSRFPQVYDQHDVVGYVTAEAAKEVGISKHTKVLAGSTDTAMATLALGILTENRMAFSCGTGSSVLMLSESSENKKFETDPSLITIGSADNNYMMNIGVMSNTGGAFKWIRDALCDLEVICAKQINKGVFCLMDDFVAEVPAGANGVIFLPYLTGELSPLYNPNARGVFFGLSVKSNKKDMMRAVMEGTCFAVKQNVDIVLHTAKGKAGEITEIVATGGPCKSDLWMQMLCDILGINVVIQEKTEGAAMGDVILAGYALGIFPDFKTVSENIVTKGKTYYPNPTMQERYNANYETYCHLVKALEPCFDLHAQRVIHMK